jgi:DNA processing protein
VLAGGIDVDYPPEHAALFAAVAESGALVAESRPGTPTVRSTFVRRNRLIAALGDACLVVQADDRSGSLSTAHAAEKLGRPTLAVPWGHDGALTLGLSALFRRGATAARTSRDVLAALGLPPPDRPDPAEDPDRSHLPSGALARRIYEALGDRDCTVDEIASAIRAKPQDICTTLLTLELQRLVVRTLSGRYGRIR